AEAIVVHGVVTDVATGAPIEGAILRAGHPEPAAETRSDASGRYELTAVLPPSEFLGVEVEKKDYGEPKDEKERFLARRAQPGGVVARDFHPRRGETPRWNRPPRAGGLSPSSESSGVVRGVVLDAAGAPAPGVDVRVFGEGSTVSDALGEF